MAERRTGSEWLRSLAPPCGVVATALGAWLAAEALGWFYVRVLAAGCALGLIGPWVAAGWDVLFTTLHRALRQRE